MVLNTFVGFRGTLLLFHLWYSGIEINILSDQLISKAAGQWRVSLRHDDAMVFLTNNLYGVQHVKTKIFILPWQTVFQIRNPYAFQISFWPGKHQIVGRGF